MDALRECSRESSWLLLKEAGFFGGGAGEGDGQTDGQGSRKLDTDIKLC